MLDECLKICGKVCGYHLCSNRIYWLRRIARIRWRNIYGTNIGRRSYKLVEKWYRVAATMVFWADGGANLYIYVSQSFNHTSLNLLLFSVLREIQNMFTSNGWLMVRVVESNGKTGLCMWCRKIIFGCLQTIHRMPLIQLILEPLTEVISLFLYFGIKKCYI